MYDLILLLIGIFVTITSAFIGDRFAIFFWIGCVFIVVGLFKLLVHYVTNSAPAPEAMLKKAYPNITDCWNCSAPCFDTAHFCHMCGMKLGKKHL